ncbi:MAG: MarP family serine protease [Solirubrobacterales bacterium]|nr:MarP family serine protease [Solirubrobacterales bacterium]
MTAVDIIIIVFAALFGALGFARGFIVGALSLAGFVGGAWLGTRLGPELLSEGSASPYAPLFGLFGALLAGAIIAAGLEGVGERVRSAIRLPGFGALDGILGTLLSAAVALGIAWLVGVVALQTPGARALRGDIQRSEILTRLNAVLPSDSVLNALARFDPFPSVDGPEVDVPAPRAAIARDPDVRDAAGSVVRILGHACGLGVSGSGWVAGENLVVTNAHVVSGQDDTVVQVQGDGAKLEATAVAFDVRNDLAVLRVDGLDAPSLSLAGEVRRGEQAAVLGFPRNGPYDVRAARIGRTRTVLSQDAYGRGPVERPITAFRGTVRPGNSGGPLVDEAGRVAATVFAKSTRTGPKGGYGVPNDIVRRALDRSGDAVDTGPCVR